MKTETKSARVQCDADKLLSLMREGNLEALDRMTRCFGERLYAVGRKYCRSDDDAQDAVQDALLAAGEHLTSFRGDGSIEGWLKRMVTNACYRMRRGRKNDPTLHDSETEQPAIGRSPEEDTMQAETAAAIGEGLLQLRPEDRLLLVLAEGEGWKGPEIAKELGISTGAVRTRLTRARQRMREHLSTYHKKL